MAIYCVTYDLKAPGRNYDDVFTYLKQFDYCKHLESFWLIDTTLSAAQLRDGFKAKVDGNDVLFVARLQKSWASLNYSCSTWLKDSRRNW
ncbi:TPA: hypothetical protein MI614_11670 [Klebsiella pneumoniae]|nr:hypothetical protein [Klebsiella pneumoniae]HCL6211485.1 hypothetical protein [Klebsiella pneumoniae]